MNQAFLTIATAPRDIATFLGIKRGIRSRLAMQIGFRSEDEEKAFLSGSDEQQADYLVKRLQQLDIEQGQAGTPMPAAAPQVAMPGSNGAGHATPSMPAMPGPSAAPPFPPMPSFSGGMPGSHSPTPSMGLPAGGGMPAMPPMNMPMAQPMPNQPMAPPVPRQPQSAADLRPAPVTGAAQNELVKLMGKLTEAHTVLASDIEAKNKDLINLHKEQKELSVKLDLILQLLLLHFEQSDMDSVMVGKLLNAAGRDNLRALFATTGGANSGN